MPHRRFDLANLNLAAPLTFTPTTRTWYSDEFRRLGAIAHFDPSLGATDDGTTSTWVDQIAGYSVASTSQATRLTYSASSGLNGRPGFSGVAGSLTKLVSSDGVLAALIDGSDACSIYVVRKASSVAAASTSVCAGNTATGHLVKLGALITTGAQVYSRNGGSLVSSTGVVQDTTGAVVVSCVYSGAAVSAWSNAGPSAVAAAHVQAPTCDRFVVGALLSSGTYSEHFSGDIGDIVIFLGAHTDAQRMYVERLLAQKYGWPCLRGVTGFTTSNYLVSAAGAGITGTDDVGVWADVLIRHDAINPASEYPVTAYDASGVRGWFMIHPVAATYATARNGTVGANSPADTTTAAMVGKLRLYGMTADLSSVRHYANGVQIGAGTALSGFKQAVSEPMYVGRPRVASNALVSCSIFGLAGGNVPQTTANQAARAAAIKAAGRFVTVGGAAATHGWRFETPGAYHADAVGGDMLTRTGTLTETQCIVPTWSW